MGNTVYWGYDASVRVDQGLAAQVQAAYARPDFVLRYLPTVEGYATGISTEEVAAIHTAGVALGLVWNKLDGADAAADYARGGTMARAAADLAASYGVPDGVAIYLDIENDWDTNPDLLGGWLDGITAHRLLPGVYLNSQNPNHVWAYQQTRLHTAAPDCLAWTAEPEYTAWRDTVLRSFEATLIPGREAETVVHQYWIESLGGSIDLDTCLERAMDHMWRPTPPAPPRPPLTHVRSTCALKPAPNHTSRSLATLLGGQTVTPLGVVSTVAGPDGKTAEAWTHVRAVNRAGKALTGWVLVANTYTTPGGA